MKSLSNQKLVFSALCIALYIVVMICTQSFAFGQYQIRIVWSECYFPVSDSAVWLGKRCQQHGDGRSWSAGYYRRVHCGYRNDQHYCVC